MLSVLTGQGDSGTVAPLLSGRSYPTASGTPNCDPASTAGDLAPRRLRNVPEPTVSVIVTSQGPSAELIRCVQAIHGGRPPAELFVADGGDADPTTQLARECPQAVVLHRPGFSLPALRWAAARIATGDIIATTEGRMEPTHAWWRALAEAHGRWPTARVIGGLVGLPENATAFDRGLYLSEYVEFAPGASAGEARSLSSGNLSYKRDLLLAESDILDRGLWDTVLHERWADSAGAMRLEPATVVFLNGMSSRSARSMRFTNGRAYAAERMRGAAPWRRALYGVGSLVLPLLLTWRAIRAALRYRSPALTPAAVGWLLWFNICWAAGEMAGYLLGDAAR